MKCSMHVLYSDFKKYTSAGSVSCEQNSPRTYIEQILLHQVRLYCGGFIFNLGGLGTVLEKSGKAGPIHPFYIWIAF